MKGSEIDDPGYLIGLKPRRFPNWGARQQPIKICPLCLLFDDLPLLDDFVNFSYRNPITQYVIRVRKCLFIMFSFVITFAL